MCGSGVEKRDEASGAQLDVHLHSVTEANTGDGLEGEDGRLLQACILGVLGRHVIILYGELLVAIVTEAETTTLLLFCRREPLDWRTTLDGGRHSGSPFVGQWCWKERAWSSGRKQRSGAHAARGSRCHCVLLPQLQLTGQAHRGRQVVHLHVEAEWGQQAAHEKLDALRLVEGIGPRKQGLEPVLIIGDGGGAATVSELEEGAERRGGR